MRCSTPLVSLGLAAIIALSTTYAHAVDPANGKVLARQCQTCHGINGIAQIPIAPNIAGESQIYLELQLKRFRSGQREHEMMTVVAKNLTDSEIEDLAAWYESIKVTATLPE
ncbi:MAG TPA: cytochrome c [Marinobacter sp.]|uniref:Cytochrome c n=2 Tax=root TaxID=1 RepID=A0A831VVG9_9GAMM|nr:cytochrome c [Marinobacter antarcticus]HDZ39268.1 cytochrome c [Marinobacter sp.]HEA52169.1 cytochrome c [Marinobacter antarcticus]